MRIKFELYPTTLSTLINVVSLMPRRVRHFCTFVWKGALMSRRALMSSARKFCRPRENFSKDRSGRRDQNRPRIVKIGAILAIFRPFEVLVPWTSLCGAQKIWTSIFCFQETGVLEELGGFERHWDVRRKNLLPVVRLFLGRVPWRRGKQGDLCFFGGFGTQNDFNHLVSNPKHWLTLW